MVFRFAIHATHSRPAMAGLGLAIARPNGLVLPLAIAFAGLQLRSEGRAP